MVYFSNGQITIRNMECKDAQAISLVAEYAGKPVGYIKCTLGISLRLLLRLIFRQMHPNLINVRSTYAS